MTTLDLHIGLHKTGTTSLQRFFAQNAAALSAHSILYPNAGRIGSSHLGLARQLRSETPLDQPIRELWQESRRSEHCKFLLLSSEEFSRAFLNPATLKQFCDLARRHFDIRLIIYLRRQDELKESLYAEFVKHTRKDVSDTDAYEYDHLKRLQILQSAVPKESLIVRRYTKDIEVERDFLSIYGFEPDSRFVPVERKNISLTRNVSMFLGKLEKHAIYDRERFAHYVARSGICPDDCQKYVLSPQQRSAFLALFGDSNRTVAEQYFPELDGKLFLEFEAEQGWLPARDSSDEEYQKLIISLWNDYARQVARRPLYARIFQGLLRRSRALYRHIVQIWDGHTFRRRSKGQKRNVAHAQS